MTSELYYLLMRASCFVARVKSNQWCTRSNRATLYLSVSFL